MKDHRVNGVRRRMGFADGFNVSPISRAGGLSLWWEDSLEVQIVFSSKHIIDAKVREVGAVRWMRVTSVYGTPYCGEKATFWNWMNSFFQPIDIPWLCGGDFNEFLWESEKSGGAPVLYNRPRYLANFMEEVELHDLDFNGSPFTWRGIRNGELVEERIDRGLCNQLWQNIWLNTLVNHAAVVGSDHCPILISCEPNQRRGRKMFHFEAMWAKEEECRSIVESCWNRQCPGDAITRWQSRINVCRSKLTFWSKRKFNHRTEAIAVLMDQLGELQLKWGPNREAILRLTIEVDLLRE
ncbi:hypothetical protein ACFX1Z_038078 [Malus domestica]